MARELSGFRHAVLRRRSRHVSELVLGFADSLGPVIRPTTMMSNRKDEQTIVRHCVDERVAKTSKRLTPYPR